MRMELYHMYGWFFEKGYRLFVDNIEPAGRPFLRLSLPQSNLVVQKDLRTDCNQKVFVNLDVNSGNGDR